MSDTTVVVLVLAAACCTMGISASFLVWMTGKMSRAVAVVVERQMGLVDRLADKAVSPDQAARMGLEHDAKEAYIRGYAAAVDKLSAKPAAPVPHAAMPEGFSMMPSAEDHIT